MDRQVKQNLEDAIFTARLKVMSVRDSFALHGLNVFIRRVLRQSALPPKEEQLPLPGFEHLPAIVAAGPASVPIRKIERQPLLQYIGWYRVQAEGAKLRAENHAERLRELKRLARYMAPFAKNDPHITTEHVMELLEKRKAERANRAGQRRDLKHA